MAFLAIVPIGAAAMAAILLWLPRQPVTRGERLGRQLRILMKPAVLLPMMVSSLASASLFATFTYITPLLQTAAGLSPREITWCCCCSGWR